MDTEIGLLFLIAKFDLNQKYCAMFCRAVSGSRLANGV